MSRLLGPDDPEPVILQNPAGTSPLLFLSDHAGLAIPRLGLGLSEAELNRHIGWDIGILGVTSRLADPAAPLCLPALFAPGDRLQPADRLVAVDHGAKRRHRCPGKSRIDRGRQSRARGRDHATYHDAIDRLLDRRQAANMPTAIICMHSCTPRLAADRNFDRGISASSLITTGGSASHCWRCSPRSRACVGRNEPYNVDIEVDYTVPVHCEEGGCPMSRSRSARILIGEKAGQQEWAERLARILPRVIDRSGVLEG